MFKNREMRVQMVKTPKDVTDSAERPSLRISFPTRGQIRETAVIVGGLYATKVVLDTACIVAVTATKAKFR